MAGPLVVLGLWEAYARSGLVDPLYLPPPSQIASVFWGLLVSGVLIGHAVASLERVFAGFLLAAVAGIGLGLLIGWFRVLSDFLDPLIELIRPVSPIALIPLAILWFGIGAESKIFVIFIGTFFPILINTIAGVRHTDPVMINAARALGASDIRILYTVSLPSAVPFIYAGLRVSMGIAFIVIVASEMVAAQNGLGWLILDSERVYRTDRMFVGIVSISTLGLLMDYVTRRIGEAAFPWINRGTRA
jgi:ABC-type nitrate/sulfonate/bicarbonate transport system permease component